MLLLRLFSNGVVGVSENFFRDLFLRKADCGVSRLAVGVGVLVVVRRKLESEGAGGGARNKEDDCFVSRIG